MLGLNESGWKDKKKEYNTCPGVRLIALASCSLSGALRYLCLLKVDSNWYVWLFENKTLLFLFPPFPPGLPDRGEPCFPASFGFLIKLDRNEDFSASESDSKLALLRSKTENASYIKECSKRFENLQKFCSIYPRCIVAKRFRKENHGKIPLNFG